MPEPLTLMAVGGVAVGGGAVGLGAFLARRYFEPTKDLMDVVLGVVSLVVFAPVMLLCAAIIKMASPGPALFVQVRVGKGGRHFRMYKLRTMHVNAERDCGAVWRRTTTRA